MRKLGIMALGAASGGCASAAADITPAYVSPVTYQSFTCEQLGQKLNRYRPRAAALSGAQDSQRTKDAVATTAAVIILWPAAFLVGGDKQTAAELAQMKRQMVLLSRNRSPRSATSSFRENRQELPDLHRSSSFGCPQVYGVIERRRVDDGDGVTPNNVRRFRKQLPMPDAVALHCS